MGVLWEDRAWDEYLGWQNEDKKTIKKINKLIKDAQRSPSVPLIIVKTVFLKFVASSSLFSDIGKPDCQVYDEKEGEMLIC